MVVVELPRKRLFRNLERFTLNCTAALVLSLRWFFSRKRYPSCLLVTLE